MSTRDSNLFLTEFILMTCMIANWFSFLGCLDQSILSLEGGLQVGVTECWKVSKVTSHYFERQRVFN